MNYLRILVAIILIIISLHFLHLALKSSKYLAQLEPHQITATLNEISSNQPVAVTQQQQPLDQCDSVLSPLICESSSRTKKDPFLEAEALGSLSVAFEMKKAGKIDKALKLFKHAYALSPTHPDILTHYGEFLEETNDIVSADQLYFKALTLAPNHVKALANRERTACIVDDIDGTSLSNIDKKRDSLAIISDSNPALRRTKSEAYILNIYHTVAIEGNTMTLAETRSILETRMAVPGKTIDEHNEILGMDLAMKYLNSTLVNRIGKISVKDILELHKRVMGAVDPVEAGAFRKNQVYVGSHIPPGPDQIILLVTKFIDWLNSDIALDMHPVRYAAIAHYKLVFIHPFIDGNGRTSRLLMNLILMQAGFPPVIIPKQFRHKYYETLQQANEGDVRPFVRFIVLCADHTLNMYLWTTTGPKLKNPNSLLEDNQSGDAIRLPST